MKKISLLVIVAKYIRVHLLFETDKSGDDDVRKLEDDSKKERYEDEQPCLLVGQCSEM